MERDPIAGAGRALMLYGMPPEEIGAVLGAKDPEIVRRYLELHRERLQERLDDQLRSLDIFETHLARTVQRRARTVTR